MPHLPAGGIMSQVNFFSLSVTQCHVFLYRNTKGTKTTPLGPNHTHTYRFKVSAQHVLHSKQLFKGKNPIRDQCRNTTPYTFLSFHLPRASSDWSSCQFPGSEVIPHPEDKKGSGDCHHEGAFPFLVQVISQLHSPPDCFMKNSRSPLLPHRKVHQTTQI